MSIPDDIIEVARPLIHRATRAGFREGMLEGKNLFLDALDNALEKADDLDDVRRWSEANRVLLQEYRL